MASYEKLPSGKYRGVYRDSHGRKQHTEAVGRARDARATAVDAESLAKRKAATNAGTLPGHTTWGEWHPIWWDKRDIEPSTADAEGRVVRLHLLPQWEDDELAGITKRDVQDWVNHLWKRDGLHNNYVRRIYTVFQSSMTSAVDEEVLGGSPCIKIKLPPKLKSDIARVYDDDEVKAIREHLGFNYRIVTEFTEETGVRPGEVGGLHRHRLDRRRGWMTVRDTWDARAKRIKTYPKDKDERQVPLSTRALELLDEWDERYPPSRSTCGEPHQNGRCKSDLMFRQPLGRRGPVAPKRLWFAWDKAQTAAGIELHGRPYDLRHRFATRLAEAGVDPWEISRLMGHANLQQTEDYVHRTKAARMRVLAALGDPAAAGLVVLDGGAQQDQEQVRPTTVPRTGS